MWKLVALEAVTFVRKNNSLTSLLYYIQITYIYIYTKKGERQLGKTRHTTVFYNKLSRKLRKIKTKNLSRDTHNYNTPLQAGAYKLYAPSLEHIN